MSQILISPSGKQFIDLEECAPHGGILPRPISTLQQYQKKNQPSMKTKPKNKPAPIPPSKRTTFGSLEIISAKCDMNIGAIPPSDWGPGYDASWVSLPPEIELKTLIRTDFSNVGAIIVNGTRFVNTNPKIK